MVSLTIVVMCRTEKKNCPLAARVQGAPSCGKVPAQHSPRTSPGTARGRASAPILDPGQFRGAWTHLARMWRRRGTPSLLFAWMGQVQTREGPAPLTPEKYRAAVERIDALLQSKPNAEELASAQKLLGSLYKTMNTGRSVAMPDARRGIPLGIAVKSLKHHWHVDGTWPLIGYDEAEKHKICDPAICILRTMQVSQHKHKDLVRNDVYESGKKKKIILPCCPAVHEIWFEEKGADAIAAAYVARGRGGDSSAGISSAPVPLTQGTTISPWGSPVQERR